MNSVTSVYIHSSGKSCFVQKGRMVPICLHCLNCTKFGQLILRKTIKIVATRGQILRQKCTKFDFGWVSAPDPAEGAYSAPPDPLARFKGHTSKEGEGKEEGPTSKGGEGEERRAGRGRGKEGKGKGVHALADSSGSIPASATYYPDVKVTIIQRRSNNSKLV